MRQISLQLEVLKIGVAKMKVEMMRPSLGWSRYGDGLDERGGRGRATSQWRENLSSAGDSTRDESFVVVTPVADAVSLFFFVVTHQD